MYASIQFQNDPELYFRVKADPVQRTDQYVVFEFTDSKYPDQVIKTVGRIPVSTHRHIAIDLTGIGHLFDITTQKLAGRLGPCVYTPDEP